MILKLQFKILFLKMLLLHNTNTLNFNLLPSGKRFFRIFLSVISGIVAISSGCIFLVALKENHLALNGWKSSMLPNIVLIVIVVSIISIIYGILKLSYILIPVTVLAEDIDQQKNKLSVLIQKKQKAILHTIGAKLKMKKNNIL